MQLYFGVKPLTKTVVAVLTGLFPKIVRKHLDGERQKRVEALIIEEKAPKIVESYLKKVLRANEGQENSGAETDEVKSLQVVESEENVAILQIQVLTGNKVKRMFKNSRQPDSLETPKQTVKKFKKVKYLDRDVDI